MTEEEANLRRCCGPEGCGGNSAGEPVRYCIASACMAWRWKTVPNPVWQPSTQVSMVQMINPHSQVPSGIPSTTDGGCGLAGGAQ